MNLNWLLIELRSLGLKKDLPISCLIKRYYYYYVQDIRT